MRGRPFGPGGYRGADILDNNRFRIMRATSPKSTSAQNQSLSIGLEMEEVGIVVKMRRANVNHGASSRSGWNSSNGDLQH